ncbi:hypothetical protein [Agromyces laixinhei]|uniref:hypothetical protein n=1 Tax=Agromyces laixinhei TaxID=2585717 RepID=UPI00143CD9EF|nr:hypothetical protein [Agromyces laixinhei]
MTDTDTITTRTASAATKPAPAPPATRRVRALALLALVSSAGVAGLGLVWLFAPALNPFAADDMRSVASALLGATPVAVIAIAAGGAGVLLTLAVLPRGSMAAHPRLTGGGAAAIALALGFSLGSTTAIAYTGYLFGVASVVAGVVTVAVMLVRAPRLGIALLAGVIALAAAFVWLAGLTLDGVAGFAEKLTSTLIADLPNLLVASVSVTVTASWVALAIIALREGPAGHRFEGWLVRHRRALTILAALGPVPYAIARASWLTPWPLFAPSASDLPADVRATGLMLGSGAVAAIILTLGLILPWGRVVPAWIPRIGGRPVPVLAAAVPGFTAAGVLCISAGSMLVTVAGDPTALMDTLIMALVLPLWYWGPMLALAVWAYTAWRSRESAIDHPGH